MKTGFYHKKQFCKSVLSKMPGSLKLLLCYIMPICSTKQQHSGTKKTKTFTRGIHHPLTCIYNKQNLIVNRLNNNKIIYIINLCIMCTTCFHKPLLMQKVHYSRSFMIVQWMYMLLAEMSPVIQCNFRFDLFFSFSFVLVFIIFSF